MKPAPFAYMAPDSLDAALEALAEHGADAKVLAGGQSLIPVMNFRLAQPVVLVDLNRIGELDFIEEVNGGLRIGGMTRQSRVEHDAGVRRLSPLLHEAVPHVAHSQIRNRGTIGGTLAHADPAAELPAIASRGGWDQKGAWHPIAWGDTRAAELLWRHKVISCRTTDKRPSSRLSCRLDRIRRSSEPKTSLLRARQGDRTLRVARDAIGGRG